MIFDGHIHIFDGSDNQREFSRKLRLAGIDGGLLISSPPFVFRNLGSPSERLERLFTWCESGANLFPFYWVDPLADDALDQVGMAVERGVLGFKVICNSYYPGDERVLPIFRKIAEYQRPILFHSGVLGDLTPSAKYNRPIDFEKLLEVEGLRFCLAHMAWPWCDELIAIYGKFLNIRRRKPDFSVEMFIDTTPGTPPIYRRQALTNMLMAGYDVTQNLIFGSDCNVHDYNVEQAKEWIARDQAIFRDLDIAEDVVANIFSENLKRFLGIPRSISP
jgi:predicted TIM-barrel fold metal-dependent hydrolase